MWHMGQVMKTLAGQSGVQQESNEAGLWKRVGQEMGPGEGLQYYAEELLTTLYSLSLFPLAKQNSNILLIVPGDKYDLSSSSIIAILFPITSNSIQTIRYK